MCLVVRLSSKKRFRDTGFFYLLSLPSLFLAFIVSEKIGENGEVTVDTWTCHPRSDSYQFWSPVTTTSYVAQLKYKVGEKCVPDWEAMSLQSPCSMEKEPDPWPSTNHLWHKSNFDCFVKSKVVPFCLHMSVAGHKAINLADTLLFFFFAMRNFFNHGKHFVIMSP